jgi:hypothetical protein
MNKEAVFKKVENMNYIETLEYLNGLYLKAKTSSDEEIILSLIESLKAWGK